VNLLDDHIVDVLLDAAAMGVNTVEREGVSVSHPARFILVGTMNPEEGELRPQLLDRFGLCVDVEGIRDLDQRVAIVEKRAKWESDPNGFYEQHAESEQDVRSHIAEGIATFPEVDLPREILRLVAQISIALEVDGHRSDLVCARAAQAKAAYDSDPEVTVTHVSDVAEMVFAHRVHAVPFGKGGPNLSEVISRMIGQAS
jgi:magnesium chelatase subunit I